MTYIKLSKNQIEKVGNALIYLSQKMGELSKTKALKLLYILDELAIKKSGIPFFNLKYKVWKFGPVSEEIFIDLSSDISLLKGFVERTSEEGINLIKPLKPFNDDEFSDNDMELLNFVIEKFGHQSAKDLVFYTHRKNAPWYNAAKNHGVLELLQNEEINNTEILVDMGELVSHDESKRALYSTFIEEH